MLLRLAIPILAACAAIPMTAQTTTIQPSAPTTQSAPRSAIATETRTFALQSGGRLKINGGGDITISAWDKDEVALTAKFTPTFRKRAYSKITAKSNINSLELTIKSAKDKTKLVGENSSCQLELKVPGNITGNIKNRFGSIELNGITGNVKAKTKVGDIYFKMLNQNGALTVYNDAFIVSKASGNISAPPGTIFEAGKKDRTITVKSGNKKNIINAKCDGNVNLQFVTKHGNIVIQ